MNVELIDFYRPDTNRKNLFITGIPQSLQENDIVVSVRFVRTQVKVRKKNLEKPSRASIACCSDSAIPNSLAVGLTF